MSRAGRDRIPKRIGVPVVAALALVLLVPSAASAANSLAVHGSVNQVYVTGAQPGTSLRLVRKGKTVSKKPVGSLGGVLFRRVAAGKGYRVRAADGSLSVPVGVMSDRSAPKDPSIYNQTPARRRLRIPDHEGRDQPGGRREAARPRLGRPLPDAGRVLGLRLRQPGRSPERHQPDPQPARLRRGRREHARHRLLRRRLRLLREAAEPRRLRRGGDRRPPALGAARPGGDGRRLLRRDQPALRRRDQAAPSRRDHAALGDRQRRDHALPGRAPQHRVRRAVGPGPGRRREAGLGHRGSGLGVQADPGGRPDLQGESDAAHRRRGPDQQDPPQPRLSGRKVANPLNPSTFVNRINVPVFLACQFNDEQTGAHCPYLADRFTGTRRKWFTFTNGFHIDSLDPETFNRWFDFLELYVAGRKPQYPPGTAAIAPVIYQTAMGVPGVTLPHDPIQDQPDYQAALNAFQALPSVRVMFDNGAGGAPGTPYPGFEARLQPLPDPEDEGALLATSAATARWSASLPRRAARAAATPSPGTRGHVRPLTSPAPTPAAVTSGPPIRTSTGASLPPERPPHSSARPWRATPAIIGGGAVSRLDSRLGPGRRPPGDGLRGAAGRQGDLRPERLSAEQLPQARPEAELARSSRS